jgi:hypothetical protein
VANLTLLACPMLLLPASFCSLCVWDRSHILMANYHQPTSNKHQGPSGPITMTEEMYICMYCVWLKDTAWRLTMPTGVVQCQTRFYRMPMDQNLIQFTVSGCI